MDKTGPHRTVPLGGIFVTGTDTNVGKTVLTAALGIALQREGFHLGVMKPIETGTKHLQSGQQTDGERLQRLLAMTDPQGTVTPYAFPDPVAPLSASRKIRQPIDFQRIKNQYQTISRNCDVCLVEGAGGVLVPLTDKQTVGDLIGYLQLPCLVVSRPTLGSVNHTLLTVEALRNRGIQVLGLVLNHTTEPTGSEAETLQIESTIQLVHEFSEVPVVGPLPPEPLLHIDWIHGVVKLSEHLSISHLLKILQKRT